MESALLSSTVDWDARYRKGWAYGKHPNSFLVEAVEQWRAEPMKSGNVLTKFKVTIRLKFSLR